MPFAANARWVLRHPWAVPRLLSGHGFRDMVLREDLRRIGIPVSPAEAAGLGAAHLSIDVVLRLRDRLGDTRFRTFLDVGAAHGGYSVAALLVFSGIRAYAFEPLPDVFEVLREVAGTRPSITTFPLAVGDADETSLIRRSRNSGSSSLLPLLPSHVEHFPGTEEAGEVDVEVRTLDSLVENGEVRVERPSLMKIDVQGYEDRVLDGAEATLEEIDAVVIELSHMPLYEGQVLLPELRRRIEDHGFSWSGPFSEVLSATTGEVVQVDGLFVRK